MLETAIVGGGLCGLALANGLAGRDFALYEARPRLGGRILTAPGHGGGPAVDLGPSWFWPETQPRMAKLVADLGLRPYPQWDSGTVLRQIDPEAPPMPMPVAGLHGGAMRLAGGMGSLVEALAERLPECCLYLGYELMALAHHGDCVELRFRDGDRRLRRVRARRAVLALPPRLLDQRIRFEPALDARIGRAMRQAPTWMAGVAKLSVSYPRAFWRERGLSGNAFASFAQAVLAEVYDASEDGAAGAVLGGFLALSPEQRRDFRHGLLMRAARQLARLFGPEAERGETLYQDWAEEAFTCATLDLAPPPHHPGYGSPVLAQPHWGGKLHFGGTETAAYGGGHLEGALEAAERILRYMALDLGLAA
jgi:monoamine oxidase